MSDTRDYKLVCHKQEALIMLMGAALIDCNIIIEEEGLALTTRGWSDSIPGIQSALLAYNLWLDDGPGEEDGPWAAGYEDRVGGSIKEEPFTDRRIIHNLQYGRDLIPPEHLLGLYINWDIEATYWHERVLSMDSSIYRPMEDHWIY